MLHELESANLWSRLSIKSSNIGVQNIVHLLLQERVRQRIQRLMLAAPRAKPIREPDKVFFVNLIEDGGHGVLDNLVFQSRDSEWALSSITFRYVNPSRRLRSVSSAMNPVMKIDQSIFEPGLHTPAR